MSESILKLCDFLTEKSHLFTEKESVIKDYSFYYITNNIINNKINQNIDQSQILVIDIYQETKQNEKLSYFIFGFEKSIIIINQSSLLLLQDLLSRNKNISFCFLSNSKTIFNQTISISYKEIENSEEFFEDISVFSQNINLGKCTNHILGRIKTCISGYLLKKSYLKLNINRIDEFSHKKTVIPSTFDKNEFIELRNCGIGSTFAVTLLYHISKEKLVVVKKPNTLSSEIQKLVQREINNYSKLNYPLFPKYYGIKNNDLIIEFINGQSLSNIKNLHLNDNEKITIVFELMIIIGFIHQNHFIYRDLKPNNIIIDENKTAVLIDFDRMIEYNDSFSEQDHTVDFSHVYSAPEITETNFSYECDIYSIGQMIYFIMNERNPKIGNVLNSDDFKNFEDMKNMYINCTKTEIKERPTISELILEFLICYHLNIEIQNLYKTFSDYFEKTYDDETIEVIKDILKDQDDNINQINQEENDPKKLYEIGYNLSLHAFVTGGDISQSIHYLTLSAEKNYPPAQNFLGQIYDCGYFFPRDFKKALHYFKLAAENGFAESNWILGSIYLKGSVVKRDFNKAVNYFNQAAEKNYDQAFYSLGAHYLYHEKDTEKAKKYLSIAADRDIIDAFLDLGIIYTQKKNYDIDKAIFYFEKGVYKGNAQSQYFLGEICYKSKYQRQDIKKALELLNSSANANFDLAQYRLGKIYLKGKIVPYDENKAVYYLFLSAKQKNSKAQYTLGMLSKLHKDNEKCIHYLKSSIENDNNPKALLALGSLYLSDSMMLDIDKGIDCLKKLSNLNHKLSALAQSAIGELYFKGSYIHHDINKAIHYLTLASDNNNVEAQINLGFLYFHSEFANKDVNKAIKYLKKASDNNSPTAQFLLGRIFSSKIDGKYDINKAIYYYKLASDQNLPEAQHNLGMIYYQNNDIKKAVYYLGLAAKSGFKESQYVLGAFNDDFYILPKDINLAIHYYKLAAEKNDINALYNLGVIYSKDKNVQCDIKLALHYLNRAADLNHSQALFNLGVIYSEGTKVPRNIKKAIEYYERASNIGNSKAQYNLGLIYKDGQYVQQDLKKAIHYFTHSSKLNNSDAQLTLGNIYYDNGNIQKGVELLIQSAKNGNSNANFLVGFLYHEGKYINQNIEYSIRHYKNASSFNDQYAKNNLGIIYKNGFGDIIKKNVANAIVYFEEAIRQKKDILATYNLGHIYLYDELVPNGIDKAIGLLIESSNIQFVPITVLLSLALTKKFGFDIEKFKQKIGKNYELQIEVFKISNQLKLYNQNNFEKMFAEYQKIDFLYNFHSLCFSKDIKINEIMPKKVYPRTSIYIRDINSLFYEGLGNI